MEILSTMDKKSQSRTSLCKSNQDPSKPNFDSKKNGLQYSRKRENEKCDNGKRTPGNRGGRAGQRYVRPREKVGGQVGPNYEESDFEIGSVQRSGGKKQNITHLMNWWSPGPERYTNNSFSKDARGCRSRKHVYHAKYNKEHYLQANCQFVVAAGHDYSAYETDPDHLVEWELIEEVRLHVSESPACPICLYLPVAAKVTRCGHIFCFSCILHYLALTDEKWRNCPICFDPISKVDLKSSITILQKSFMRDEEIEFILMRRDRESLVPVPMSSFTHDPQEESGASSRLQSLLTYSKLIVASKNEVIRSIVGRELMELRQQFDAEGDEPEACFISEALSLVSQRESLLQNQTGPHSDSSEGAVGLYPSGNLLDGLSMDALRLGGLTLDKMSKGKTQNSKGAAAPSDVAGRSGNQDMKNGPKQTYYFYQESSGAHTYLNFLNAQMLIKEYGSLENCPLTITAKVVEKESLSMSEHLRHRMRWLGHLPLSCTCEIVEVDVKPPMVSLFTLSEFQAQLDQRERKRKKKLKEEHRIEKRVQIVEDRLMGRPTTRCAKINTTSYRHFPSFAAEVTQTAPESQTLSMEIPIQAPADTIAASSSLGSSTADEVPWIPGISPPSFAQMIRCGQKKPAIQEQFPSLGSSLSSHQFPSLRSNSSGAKKAQSSDEDEEVEKVPDYSAAFFDDFDKALEQAMMKKATESSVLPQGSSQRSGKGKKKKKGIVLLSSGGR